MRFRSIRVRPWRLGAAFVVAAAVGVPLALSMPAKVGSKTFALYVNKAFKSCVRGSGVSPTAKVTVQRGTNNDTLTINLAGIKPGLAFDMFAVENSPQNADGTPDEGFTTFGLAWYLSDVQAHSDGTASATIQTILLDQIFGFDAGIGLGPTNTFHLGLWFNDPADAAACGFEGFTPFNGEHHAGPLAFVSRPNPTTDLGPLCTDPNTSTDPATCNP